MPQGLQIWDDTGKLIVDTSTNIGKILGSTTITAGVSGHVANSKFALGTPFWSATTEGADAYGAYPVVTYNAGLVRIEWTASAAADHLLVYGVL